MEEIHHIAALAAKYVNTTDRHIFLTGKAGTGKTTFLKYIKEHTFKKAVVAAPTGVAAINAGGVTLHSLLQLPFGLFVPENISISSSNASTDLAQVSQATRVSGPVNTPRTLFRETRFNVQKRKLIGEIELLIIDEVSMLRADLLDCIDHTLRHLRSKHHQPFGGIQMLFIGDLLQLPPVVREEEKQWLQPFYPSLFFFHARALQKSPPILIELQKVYRQKDQSFVQLLNRFRHNQQTTEDIRKLNERCQPGIGQTETEGRIFLTTHNHKADRINQMRLRSLDQKEKIYSAIIEGDFPEKMFPVDLHLKLKKGAQVMFIKNDSSGEGAFFNGKIACVSHLNRNEIFVTFDDGEEILVPRYIWEHKRYLLNKDTNDIEEKFQGSFEQYPLRLAWAVTIHKSQGLTFDKALLDLSQTFSPGQLYVALSRLTSLDGMILSSPLPAQPPGFDEQLVDFTKSFPAVEELSNDLEIHRKAFILHFAMDAFELGPVLRKLGYHLKDFDKDQNRSAKQQYRHWTQTLMGDISPLQNVAGKFLQEVKRILEGEEYLPPLSARLEKASEYFRPRIKELEERIRSHFRTLKKEKKVKSYLKELEALESLFNQQSKKILKLVLFVKHAVENKDFTRKALQEATPTHAPQPLKRSKTPTAEVTFSMFKEGKNIMEIAKARGLAPGTIEGHLCQYVEKGELDVLQVMDQQKLQEIMQAYHQGSTSSGKLKSVLGSGFTYGEIRLALAHAKNSVESQE